MEGVFERMVKMLKSELLSHKKKKFERKKQEFKKKV